jgi:hypothetical protein
MIGSLTTQICPRMIMMLLHVLETIELWDAVETIDSLDQHLPLFMQLRTSNSRFKADTVRIG